jgi:hypothetical protein
MRALHERPKVSDLPPANADVLIEEARRRHRHRQFIVASMVTVFAAGLAIGQVSFSGGPSPPGSSSQAGSSNGKPSAVSSGIEQGRSIVANGIEKGRAIVPWVVSGYNGTPFGSLAVAANGTLYYADLEYGQIDELTPRGPRILLSSLAGASNANQSIDGLGGLFVTSYGLFFVAEGGVHQATLTGKDIFGLANTFGATDIDVLKDGTIYYTTSNGIYEIGTSGKSVQVAGGGNLGPGQWRNGLPATEAAIQPLGLVGVSASKFYFTTVDNELDIVQNGEMSEYQGGNSNFFNGEMTSAPNGAIYGICGWSMCKMTGSTFTRLFRIPTKVQGTFVAPSDIAVAPNGDFYESFTSQSSPGIAGVFEMSAVGKLLRVLVTRDN